jgi:hypothetical protein
MSGDDRLAEVALRVEETGRVVLPLTGEVVDLGDPADVARGLARVRDLKTELDELRSLLEDVLRLESQRQGTKTLRLGDVEAVVSGGARTEFDAEALAEALRAAGCPEERIADLIVETVSYRVDARVAKQLEAANRAYAEAIASARTVEPAPWRVSLRGPGSPSRPSRPRRAEIGGGEETDVRPDALDVEADREERP